MITTSWLKKYKNKTDLKGKSMFSFFKKKFPFDDSEQTSVITCKCIIQKGAPILYVSHDADGEWQFLCGRSHNTADAAIATLRQIYKLDRSVADLATLSINHCAQKDYADQEWTIAVN